jgi:hypothetical protein
MAWGRGGARGFGRRAAYPSWGGWSGLTYGSPYDRAPEDEINFLKGEADAVKSELDAINKRIEEIESKPSESRLDD